MQEKGDEKSWNTMLARYTNEKNAQEKGKLLGGLGKLTTNNSLKMLAEVFVNVLDNIRFIKFLSFSVHKRALDNKTVLKSSQKRNRCQKPRLLHMSYIYFTKPYW